MPSPVDQIPQTTQDFLQFKELLYQLVVDTKAQRVLETGTDVGDSARIFSSALQQTGGQLITVDLKPPVNDWPSGWAIKNIQFAQADAKTIKPSQPIDLLFLDDDHAEAHVQQELAKLAPWVRVGGKILLHDTWHSEFGEGITRVIRNFVRLHQIAWTDYPQGHGLAILEISHPIPHPT